MTNTNEDTSVRRADDETFRVLSDEEREQQLLALADAYTSDVNQDNLPLDEYKVIDQKWEKKLRELGVRKTNNLHVWFSSETGPLKAFYDIHGKDTEKTTPAVIYLRQLQIDEPELYAACVEADKENAEAFADWLRKTGGMGPQTVDHTRARWTLDLRMTTAFDHMLTYPGASEELLDTLDI
ncbi:MAG: hypothetical protein JWN26_27 [Candidatus Saccharibacteria bacterium]|nr:hypothetical protein [Candidatus Saccharibacteria bacterium]